MWPQNWFHPAITVLRRYQFVCHTAVIQPLPKTQKADLKNPADHSWPDFQRGANKSTASICFTKKEMALRLDLFAESYLKTKAERTMSLQGGMIGRIEETNGVQTHFEWFRLLFQSCACVQTRFKCFRLVFHLQCLCSNTVWVFQHRLVPTVNTVGWRKSLSHVC